MFEGENFEVASGSTASCVCSIRTGEAGRGCRRALARKTRQHHRIMSSMYLPGELSRQRKRGGAELRRIEALAACEPPRRLPINRRNAADACSLADDWQAW